jgi:hypothetical protein
MSLKIEVEEYLLDGTDLKYYSISNLKLKLNSGLETTKVYGNSYILEVVEHSHFHHFQDKIGQYEMLKEIVPDLKLVVVGNNYNNYPPTDVTAGSLVLEQSLSIYGINKKDLLFLDQTDIWFEKTFYFVKVFNSFINDTFPGNELLSPFIGKDYYSYNIETAKKIRELYLNGLGLKESKIFITRKRVSNIVRTMNDLFEKTYANTATEEEKEELSKKIRIFGNEEYAKKVIKERLITEEDEDRLEDFFVSLGYLVIDPYDMTFFNQVQLFNRATHVVSVRGSGLYNTIFCNENANVFIIDLSNEYDFEYKSFAEVATANVYEIPVSRYMIRNTPQNLFMVNNIIKILKSHYLDKL